MKIFIFDHNIQIHYKNKKLGLNSFVALIPLHSSYIKPMGCAYGVHITYHLKGLGLINKVFNIF